MNAPVNLDTLGLADELNSIARRVELLSFAISGLGSEKTIRSATQSLSELADDIVDQVRQISEFVHPAPEKAGDECA